MRNALALSSELLPSKFTVVFFLQVYIYLFYISRFSEKFFFSVLHVCWIKIMSNVWLCRVVKGWIREILWVLNFFFIWGTVNIIEYKSVGQGLQKVYLQNWSTKILQWYDVFIWYTFLKTCWGKCFFIEFLFLLKEHLSDCVKEYLCTLIIEKYVI